nr:retrotransposon Orf1 [Tanacetum cinerariifolium]GEY32192.1 retrotransposon Orf1 [Tanacetum cinerariifolium]
MNSNLHKPPNGSFSAYSSNTPYGSSNYQPKIKRVLFDFDSHQEDRLSSLGIQLKQYQDKVINKINTLWKVVSDNAPTHDIAKNSMVHANVVSHNHQENGALPNKGIIKSPSKLLSPKYQVQKDDERKETCILEPNATKINDRNITVEIKKTVEKESRDSETEEGESSDIGRNDETSNPGDRACEVEREIGEEGEWMEYDQPFNLVDTGGSLNFDFRIKKGDPSNLTIPCMIGRKFIVNTYIDLDFPMNVMSLAYYNTIRNQEYEYRGLNFVRIGKDMHVFVRNIGYVMDFTIFKNVEANIDPSLSQVVFGRPVVETTKLTLDMWSS